jgi:predicted aspartyl protease
VRYRRGEVDEASKAYDRATELDPCLARTHFDIARFMNLNGRYASAQVQLNMAHYLAPGDPSIERAWRETQQVQETPEQTIARLKRMEERGDLTEERKAAIENSIQAIQAQEKGNCELVQPVKSAKLTMWASNGTNSSTRPPTNSGVDVFLNGKRRRFIVDTGASGLLLSKEAAKSLGLTPEAELKTFGFGDSGPSGTYVAHVDSVKIGGLEFHNCIVRVLENHNMPWTDGLLGPDVFRSFVVTLDFPGSEMRLSPLPKLPDDAVATPASLGTSGDGSDQRTAGMTLAESRRDRYIAPEMKDWERVYRSGHDLIFPTQIGKVPKKLFIMDTGSGQDLISIQAAKEVTGVSAAVGGQVRGISGKVDKVSGTDALYLQFAHVREVIPIGINAIDLSNWSRSTGVEISGFIGYPMLKELVISIDYRDNLVKVEYKPHVEARAH